MSSDGVDAPTPPRRGATAEEGVKLLIRNEEVGGSIPLGSTTGSPDTVATICLLSETLPDEVGAARPPTRPSWSANSRPSAFGGGLFPPAPGGEAEHGRGQEGREKQLAMPPAH
jgi:hypothetical protein